MSNTIERVLKNVDRGIYKAAQTARDSSGEPMKRSTYGYLTDLMLAEGIGPSESEIDRSVARLMARSGIPSDKFGLLPEAMRSLYEQYATDIWGLEQAFAYLGVRVKGAGADRLEKLFATTASAVLFPVYVETQVMAGILATPILADLIATETQINSHLYASLALADAQADRELRLLGEGATLPTTRIATADRGICLYKFGRMLEATYEALRLQRMNVISLFLQRVGRQIAIDETDWAIETLIAGDGNAGSAIDNTNDLDADVQGTLDYDELVKLKLAFADGYDMTTAVTKTGTGTYGLRAILNMAEFKDPMAGFTFQRSGILPGPMGATWHRWDSVAAPHYVTQCILALDNRAALEQVTEQGVMTESDRLIDKQFERTAISKWTGFAKLDYNAVKVLDINAEI